MEEVMRSISTSDLLGRQLNDVEIKYVPEILYVEGPLQIPLPCPRVSVVGSRKASSKGIETAKFISKTLTKKRVLIVSGLAEGIDTAAHETAIQSGGNTVAVLGTPLDKTYPRKNLSLQQKIMSEHLAISQFQLGHITKPKDFVIRNRTMALISDATVIVEAGDKSGSLHQGWEALRLGRPLYIWHDILDAPGLEWPEKMLRYGAIPLSDPQEVFEILPSSLKVPLVFQ
jgi:DNA processing protein